MYYEYFGLTQAPFKITPNTDFFFSGGNRGPVLEALLYAITRGEGIVKVTGEVGSGKTMLCNMLQNLLPETVVSVYLPNPNVAPEEVLHAIAFELQLGLDRQADRLEVMHALQDYLLEQHAQGNRVVIFIEESQSMPLATLEEIRLLSNLETRNDKLLQIVLFGQPELDENLRRSDIRQLRDRIAHSFRLQPLSAGEVREYLMFRMRAAGYHGPELFPQTVVKRIARASAGLTRRINLIADKALLAAYAENTHTLHAKHGQAALHDSEFAEPGAKWKLVPRPALGWAALLLLIGAAGGAGLYALLDERPAKAAKALIGTAVDMHTGSSPAVPALSSQASAGRVATVNAPNAAPLPATDAVVSQGSLTRVAADVESVPIGVAAAAAPITLVLSDTRASVPGANSRVPREAAGDLIANRLEATREWLASPRASPYSIQLLVADDEHQLRKHLKTFPKFIDINELYMYRSEAQGRRVVNVLWGSFRDRQAAYAEIVELPTSLQANRPYVRAVSAIRAELGQQHQLNRP
jgi:MSHA biogenesis protein MshM